MTLLPIPKQKAPPPKQQQQKQFKIESWTSEKEGEKIIVYGDSGMGKTTLATLAPNPVFIGLDDGGRKIKNPKTGEPLKFIPDIKDFKDVRAAIQWYAKQKENGTLIIDTITELEQWAIPYMLSTIPTEKGGVVQSIETYGWNKGYQHWHETMRLILQDCDAVIKTGKNVIMIAQGWPSKHTHPQSEDFLKDGPQLSNRTPSNLAQYVSWTDHVFRIGYQYIHVKNKKGSGTTDRAIYVHPEVWFIAKSRTISNEYNVVSFEKPDDDSIWKLLFGEK